MLDNDDDDAAAAAAAVAGHDDDDDGVRDGVPGAVPNGCQRDDCRAVVASFLASVSFRFLSFE